MCAMPCREIGEQRRAPIKGKSQGETTMSTNQIPGAAARPVSVRPTTSSSAVEGAPGVCDAAAPVHQSEAEVARTARTGDPGNHAARPSAARGLAPSASGSRSGLPVDVRMPSRLGGAGRSEPTILHMTWLPWPVRLIHTRGAL